MLDTNSNRYHATHWRNADTKIEEVMDDFIFFLRYDYPDDVDEKYIQKLINAFLGFNMDNVKQGEQEMLDQWIKATTN